MGTHGGASMLHAVAINENSLPRLAQMLVRGGLNVNHQCYPRTWKYGAICNFARWLVCAGYTNGLFNHFADKPGSTPLMVFVANGKVAEAQELIAARADTALK